ncbi:hypothetical protein OH687_09630 [Burkholderia anthina]|nr:hypothetical protein OH687_09630 [Burkholderia anthina]
MRRTPDGRTSRHCSDAGDEHALARIVPYTTTQFIAAE